MTRIPTADEAGQPGLRGLALPAGFDSGDSPLETFYIPVLSRAVRYDRSVGYFRSSSLSVAARGMSRFINNGGTVRLLVGAQITSDDRDALIGADTLDGVFAQRLASHLVTSSDVDKRRLEVLGWLARQGRLQVRIAIAVDTDGAPLVDDGHNPYFHEKIGVLTDTVGDGVAFQGSVNESATAWTVNFEAFSVYTSWSSPEHYALWAGKFDDHWRGELTGFRVYALPEAVRKELVSLAPDEPPGADDPEEVPPVGAIDDVIRFTRLAPRLVGAGPAVAEATTGVELFPHQRQVVERLAGGYPRSWLVADEVGLGKTISAGMSLRRLLLNGQVTRALILAPANVCRQWQDELFEKFGLWVPRLDGNKIYGARPSDVRPAGTNPYADHEVLIASSHLARRPSHHKLIVLAGPYDLVVVDEAHHARRQHAAEDRYRPSRLLELLDTLDRTAATQAVWLLTATPMQVSHIELVDLLRQAGLQGPLADPDNFVRYFRELAKSDARRVRWAWLDQTLQQTPRLPQGRTEQALLEKFRSRLGAVPAAWIEQFGTGDEPGADIAAKLDEDGIESLREWLRLRSPIGQYVTRHSRDTLRHYRKLGYLQQNLADRDVAPVLITFSDEEQRLYDQLEALIDRLLDASGKRQGAGLVLTVYRRRLTSSWAAIEKTLSRRLAHETFVLDDDQLDDDDTTDPDTVDDVHAVPLSDEEVRQIRRYIDRIATVPDSKLNQLRHDIDEARSARHSTIVFSQFTDTVNYLRDTLTPIYHSQLATFTGAGGSVYRDGRWVGIGKNDLVEALRAGMITVLIANDAASEGLNLHSCSYMINFDMPWNPMKVEQRIGRIDRLGQARNVVHVRNYFIPNTVEQTVYSALADRIDDFRDLLGSLQPILGATERTFQSVFRASRSERAAAEQKAITELLEDIDTLSETGVDISAEDPMPLPDPGVSPITLDDLHTVFVDRLGMMVDTKDDPVTFDPSRASRDAEEWTALATYGHPRVTSILADHAPEPVGDTSALVTAGGNDGPAAAVRADRTPPRQVAAFAEIDDLADAVSRGEAETLAIGLVEDEEHRIQDRHTTIARARERQWLHNIRSQFIDLAHGVLAAGCAAQDDGTGYRPEPAIIWHDLKSSQTDGLAYLEAFRVKLGIALGELIGPNLADRMSPVSQSAWARTRRRDGDRLLALMTEYRRVAQEVVK